MKWLTKIMCNGEPDNTSLYSECKTYHLAKYKWYRHYPSKPYWWGYVAASGNRITAEHGLTLRQARKQVEDYHAAQT